jgi:hypothetical protein
MILYTNGCSWTAGGGLDDLFIYPHNNELDEDKRLSLLWPKHLGDLLGAKEVYNLSNGCGSNQRIVRKTYNWLLNKTKEELKETVAVIQFTEWSRFEIYDPKVPANGWDDHPDDWVNCKIDVICHDIQYRNTRYRTNERHDEILNEAKHRILQTHELEDFYRTITYLYALQGLFYSFGVKDFYVWHQSHLWHQWPESHRNSFYENFKVLDRIDDPKLYHAEPFWKYERVSATDQHPGVEGNKQLANHIYQAMKRLGFKE